MADRPPPQPLTSIPAVATVTRSREYECDTPVCVRLRPHGCHQSPTAGVPLDEAQRRVTTTDENTKDATDARRSRRIRPTSVGVTGTGTHAGTLLPSAPRTWGDRVD